MPHYPVELILTGQPVLVIGGGAVARRKVAGLLECGARVTVAAPVLEPWLTEQAEQGAIHSIAAPFTPALLAPRPLLVFAAGPGELNREVARLCREQGILCNSADDPGVSGFLVNAVVRRGGVSVGIGTGGQSPALSRLLKERIDAWLEPEWGEVARLFGAERERVRQAIPDATMRQRFWRETCLAVGREGVLKAGGAAWFKEKLDAWRKP